MAEPIDEHFLNRIGSLCSGSSSVSHSASTERVLELFDAQLGSRHLDLAAREDSIIDASGRIFHGVDEGGEQ